MLGCFRAFINYQFRLSASFDRLLPERYRVDGHDDFRHNILPAYVGRDMVIYDVGGGRRPYVDAELKRRRNLEVIGLDVDRDELDNAPDGLYDSTICADITQYEGQNDADLVICQATLEHVRDTEKALAALATIAKFGGRVALFVPSRNAVFARLNLVLPEGLKRLLLSTIFGDTTTVHGGFSAYYDKCTPEQFQRMAEAYGFEVERENLYYSSGYFAFFVPAHILWRLWMLGYKAFAGKQAAETFVMVLRRLTPPAAGQRLAAVRSSAPAHEEAA